MKDKGFVIGVFVVTLLLLGGGIYAAVSMSGSTGVVMSETAEAKMEISEKMQDFGEVTLDGGDVVRSFEVKNVGSGELTLANFVTSCMCTTVEVNAGGERSPKFGMHSKAKWQGRIAPGETGEIVVTFDPDFHGPSGKGSITRMIKFETNDPNSREAELMMTGKVI